MLKKAASGVLASLRGSTYRSVRLASSFAAALLTDFFSILRACFHLALHMLAIVYLLCEMIIAQPAKAQVHVGNEG